MHVQLHQSLYEPKGDTIVDPTGGRRLRRRRVRRSVEREQATCTDDPTCSALGVRGDAGNTLAASMLTSVRVREAIVRRNHQIDLAERAPRRPSSSPRGLSLVRVEWVRARDTGLKVERIGPDTIVVRGVASGCVPSRAQATGRSTSSVSRCPALSIGLNGATYTEPVQAGEDAATCVTRWCDRLGDRYELEVLEADASVQVRFVRPLALM